MKTTAASRPAVNVYSMVNQRIMELLESGTVPWRKPWRNAEAGQPKNLISKREYSGIYCLLLGFVPYGSQYWLTFKQAVDLKGHIKKGEKSSLVVFWKWIDRTGDSETVPDDVDGSISRTGKIPMLRYYNVFNLEQTEGITQREIAELFEISTPAVSYILKVYLPSIVNV